MSSYDRSLLHDNRTVIKSHDFAFVSTSPLVSHCHHFNLFFEQIIDDALGWELGREVRVDSSYEASSQLIHSFIHEMPPTTLGERLDIARSMFAGMGLGLLEFDVTRDGGTVIGRNLHHSHAWLREHAGPRRRAHAIDAVASGFIAAAVEAAFGLPLGSVYCSEKRCIAAEDCEHCEFQVVTAGEETMAFGVTKADIIEILPEAFGGLNEDRIKPLATELREFVLAARCDKRGLIENYGVFLSHQLANYYNHCSHRMLGILSEDKPAALDVAKELLRECGHQDGYFTFGGILRSAEWEALVSAFQGEPRVIVDGCVAMARALGFGHWSVEAYEPEKLLTLIAPGTYESAYHRVAYPEDATGRCYMFQGAALAAMDLAHSVDWTHQTEWGPDAYRKLRTGVKWKATETHCLSSGDDKCRVVVEVR